jgi:hypothetical protein
MAAPAASSTEAAKGMIRLHLHVHDHHFIQPCKEGNQTVKWLSMVASQRFAIVQTPRGERESSVARGGRARSSVGV